MICPAKVRTTKFPRIEGIRFPLDLQGRVLLAQNRCQHEVMSFEGWVSAPTVLDHQRAPEGSLGMGEEVSFLVDSKKGQRELVNRSPEEFFYDWHFQGPNLTVLNPALLKDFPSLAEDDHG